MSGTDSYELPDQGRKHIIVRNDTDMVVEIDARHDPLWIAISTIGATGLLLDQNDWPAFVRLVTDADKQVRRMVEEKP